MPLPPPVWAPVPPPFPPPYAPPYVAPAQVALPAELPIADLLVPTVAPVQPAPPLTGLQTLGDHFAGAFGNAPDREAARAAGTRNSLLGAQTEMAIVKAKGERDAQAAKERLRTVNWSIPAEAAKAQADLILAGGGADFAASQQGYLRQQEMGFRGELAAPESTPEQRANAQFGVQGKYEPFTPMGAGGVVDIRNPGLGVQTTPLGKSLIDENVARAAASNAQAALHNAERATPGAAKPPSGYMADPANPGALKPIPGGPATDPSGMAGRRASQSLRKEFRSLPSVKEYETILPLIESAKHAPDDGFGDLQLIYTAGKVMDPGSVVREGELALTIAAGSPLQRLLGVTQFTAAAGGRLTPQTRAQLLGMLDERAKGHQQAYQRDYDQYSEYAREQRFDPREVVGSAAGTAYEPRPARGSLADAVVPSTVAPSTAAPARPKVDARGWKLKTDASGNQAYVSPDGTQFEEVR